MKKITFSLIILLLAFSFSLTIIRTVEASPGGLDRNGGHRCRKSISYCAKYGLRLNQYHCHRPYCRLTK